MSVIDQINRIEQDKISKLTCDVARLAYLNLSSEIKEGSISHNDLYDRFSDLNFEDIDDSLVFEIQRDLSIAQQDYLREQEEFKKRVKKNKNAFLDINSKYENLKFDDLNKIDKKFLDYAQKYCEQFNSRFKPFGVHLILSGNRGIGKTSLAVATCLNLIEEHGIKCSFVNLPHFISEMQNFDRKEKLLDSIISSDLVLIDDYGLTRRSEFAVEQIYMLIDELYRQNISMIVTTNSDKKFLLNDNTSFSAITSRILDNSIFLEMEGKDIRKSRVYDPEKVFGV